MRNMTMSAQEFKIVVDSATHRIHSAKLEIKPAATNFVVKPKNGRLYLKDIAEVHFDEIGQNYPCSRI